MEPACECVCVGEGDGCTPPPPHPNLCKDDSILCTVYYSIAFSCMHCKWRACSVSQFLHSCICERFIYSHDRSAYFAAAKYVERSWEYINFSQTHECRNWDWDRAIPFLGIQKGDFHCSVSKHLCISYVKKEAFTSFLQCAQFLKNLLF